MKIKLNSTTPDQLDRAVAKYADLPYPIVYDEHGDTEEVSPSTDWSQGGPIIEREKMTLEWTGENWMAYIRHDDEYFGPTPLIAAMRCYVASKLGDEVEIPEELR